ncbi:DUF320 domain-containing protein [Streptomyces sp. ISL-98]|uniref:chaplin n=1 Tax=Streptomyces sp. ISL-98 TaxID=2819192 RepID=UPI001BEC7F45|nr:chaplin family protein [Streptomyces sp. ISL-98]MBT2510435.1 DUF320 domain-containing protein [Streptomyces sp. ISL-98]
MRQVTRKGLITVAAASGVLAMSGGYAHAGSGADGSTSDSPGVLSGNTVQAPVNVPVNACGNTVNVIGVLNPAMGNNCVNESGKASGSKPGSGKNNGGGASADGRASDSPGVGSGNTVQVPVDVPVNACGNTVTVGGLGNSAEGNTCGNNSGDTTPPGSGDGKPPTEPEEPGKPGEPSEPGKPGEPGNPGSPVDPENPGGITGPDDPSKPGTPNNPDTQTVTQPKGTELLAETGAGPLDLLIPAGAGLLLGGAVLYHRARRSAA